MKPKIYSILVLSGMLTLSSCDDTDDKLVSEQERIQQVVDRLEKNETVSYKMFDLLTERLTSDSLQDLMTNTKDRETFINVVARQSDGYFEEAVGSVMSQFDVAAPPMPFAGEAEITLKGLASAQVDGAAPFDVIAEYSNIVLKRGTDQAAEGKKDWVLIESWGSDDPPPAESLSLNFEKIKMLASVPNEIIMNLELTDEEMLEQVDAFLRAKDIPPVAIALLVPAVQKLRQNDNGEQPFEGAMKGWLNGPIKQAINGGLNRDIIRRIHAAVYLASLHTLLLDDYDGSNPDAASLSILHARYRAALIMGAREVWQE